MLVSTHEYNGFCILETSDLYTEGTCLMCLSIGEESEARIPRFFLQAPAN
jgi:uncharacterized protein affecting Mg2+/Co2+ transport